MDLTEVKQFVLMIEGFTNRNISEISLSKIADSLKSEPKEAARNFLKALDNGNYTGRLDPIDIIREVKGLATNMREKQAREEKRQFAEGLNKATTKSDIGKHTMLVIRGMLTGKITASGYIDGLYHLEDEYPGLGFSRSASNCQRIFERTGQPKNEPCRPRPIDPIWRTARQGSCTD